MLFHSPIFLCAFLPLVLLLAWGAGRRGRNGVLLLASLFFYAWGEGRMVAVLAASAVVHWALAGVVARRGTLASHLALAAGVVFDLGLLLLFKYAGWLLGEVPALALALRPEGATGPPIGVSFFTFQALSYLVDVHRGVVPPQRSPFKFALYLSLFPQLIAGPIVRYADVATQIDGREVGLSRVADGFRRFITGLGKKVLLAGTLAPVTEEVFALSGDELTTSAAWLGLASYSLQIYLDFSGYSDMAIGLGRMLGFEFLENFLHPYASRSVTEFWRRWHVSLSSWFRDYLYIPLGGNRKGRVRTGVNLVAVFLLCGVWHGAAWTFVVWGAWHGALLVLERVGGGARLDPAAGVPGLGALQRHLHGPGRRVLERPRRARLQQPGVARGALPRSFGHGGPAPGRRGLGALVPVASRAPGGGSSPRAARVPVGRGPRARGGARALPGRGPRRDQHALHLLPVLMP